MLRVISNHKNRIASLMKTVGVDHGGLGIMLPKSEELVIKTGKLSTISANILKQQLLSLGADAAVARWSITGSKLPTDCLIIANESQLEKLAQKLQSQPFGLKQLSEDLTRTVDNYRRCNFIFRAGKFKLDLSKRTHLMGIINATPDSFSGDGLYAQNDFLLNKDIVSIVKIMQNDGADIIDIGGESTRPSAKPISAKEERNRVIPLIKKMVKYCKAPVSIDTYKSEVAKEALESGASIVNDISGLRFDKKMAKLIAKFKAGVVIMHIRGNPRDMQKNTRYHSLNDEILDYLGSSTKIALDAGVPKDSIVVDPGVGFGKTREQNLEIINNLSEFKGLGFPILVGLSRKSFIGATLNSTDKERLMGTAGCVAMAIANGANIVRVHDVGRMSETVRMIDAVRKS